MQTFVDTRQPEDEPLMRKIANEFLQNVDRKYLESDIGRPYGSLKFNAAEYLGLQQLMTPQLTMFRKHTVLYKFLLTIDACLRDMRALYRTLSSLDTIGKDSVFDTLQTQLPHPLYIPWDLALSEHFKKADLETQAAISLKGQTVDRDKVIATLYILQLRCHKDCFIPSQRNVIRAGSMPVHNILTGTYQVTISVFHGWVGIIRMVQMEINIRAKMCSATTEPTGICQPCAHCVAWTGRTLNHHHRPLVARCPKPRRAMFTCVWQTLRRANTGQLISTSSPNGLWI
jgi:hypothetical protein